MSFLPENYESPKSSNFYMKIQEGENRIRILTAPIMGWEDWQDKKPVRFTLDQKPPKSFDPKKPVRHFWAFVVYNYIDQRIQILHITQATIRKSLEALCKDSDWGDPYAYDLKIIRTGEGVDTEYTVNPVPHKPTDQSIIDLFYDQPCNLEALFTNEDPFAPHWETFTKLGIHDKAETKKPEAGAALKTITQDQATQLAGLLGTCDADYVKTLWDTLKKQKIVSISQIPAQLFDRIKTAALNNQKKGENDIDVLFPLTTKSDINSMDELVGV